MKKIFKNRIKKNNYYKSTPSERKISFWEFRIQFSGRLKITSLLPLGQGVFESVGICQGGYRCIRYLPIPRPPPSTPRPLRGAAEWWLRASKATWFTQYPAEIAKNERQRGVVSEEGCAWNEIITSPLTPTFLMIEVESIPRGGRKRQVGGKGIAGNGVRHVTPSEVTSLNLLGWGGKRRG